PARPAGRDGLRSPAPLRVLGARTLESPRVASVSRDTDGCVHREAASCERIRVDWGSGVILVHHSPLNSPASPNQPRKSSFQAPETALWHTAVTPRDST